ncbi:MAG: hypothetical protein HOH66_15715 [Rhodospirillaceae bacterium]|nr:hypothetical protein [Rhodospirillaceae bacterium]MBT6119310.1 hypothetical protein [Rhodospirillaceae bacterium]
MAPAIRDGRAAAILRLRTARSGQRAGAALLQAADRALGRIAGHLAAMRVMAGQAASPSRSEAERLVLQDRFAASRTEIGRLVDGAAFNGARLLRGGRREACQVPRILLRRFHAAEIGYRVQGHMGFEGFAFRPDAPNLLAGDVIRVEYDAPGSRIAVTNMTTGRRALAAAPTRGPAIGKTLAVEVPGFGMRIDLNDGFLAGRANLAPLKNPGLNEFVLEEEHEWTTAVAMLDRAVFPLGDDGEAAISLESARLEEIDETLPCASIATAAQAGATLPRIERACERLVQMRAACAQAPLAPRAAANSDVPPDPVADKAGAVPALPVVAARAVAPGTVPAMRRLLLLQ